MKKLTNNELIKTIEELENYIYNNEVSHLAHYTSPEGLESIIKYRTLRFTHSKYLNDKSEGKLIYELLDSYLDNFSFSKDFVNKVREVLIDELSPIEVFLKKQEDPNFKSKYYQSNQTAFLCCFSLDWDSLAMWNYYTKNQNSIGFNLCLKKNELVSRINNGVKSYSVITTSVYYDDEKQEDIVTKILKKFYDMWIRADNNKDAVIDYFADFIDSIKYAFKHKSYKHEQEYRIILFIYNSDINNMIRNKEINIIQKNGVFIPYIDIECVHEYNLDRITISPSAKDEIVVEGVHNLLNYYNLDGVQVSISESPSRY